jgi:hypothetical protein
MRINDTLCGSPSCRSIEQFHESRLVRITRGALAIWLDPFGMLNPEVVVNLFPKLGVGVDFVKHGHRLGERLTCGWPRLV